MNTDRIIGFIAVFVAIVALLLTTTDRFLEFLRIPLIYLSLFMIVVLAIWLVVITARKSLTLETKILLGIAHKLGVTKNDMNKDAISDMIKETKS